MTPEMVLTMIVLVFVIVLFVFELDIKKPHHSNDKGIPVKDPVIEAMWLSRPPSLLRGTIIDRPARNF